MYPFFLLTVCVGTFPGKGHSAGIASVLPPQANPLIMSRPKLSTWNSRKPTTTLEAMHYGISDGMFPETSGVLETPLLRRSLPANYILWSGNHHPGCSSDERHQCYIGIEFRICTHYISSVIYSNIEGIHVCT